MPTTRAVRPRWLLEEMGLDYELINEVEIKDDALPNPDSLSIQEGFHWGGLSRKKYSKIWSGLISNSYSSS